MIIKLPIPFKGSKGEEKLYALFDTGSTCSCIRDDLSEKLGNTDRLPEPMYFCNSLRKSIPKVEDDMRLNFEINDVNLSDEVW